MKRKCDKVSIAEKKGKVENSKWRETKEEKNEKDEGGG